MLRGLWEQVLYPLATGIVVGVGSKLGATLVRYYILSYWLGYRKFMTPEEISAYTLLHTPK